MLPLAECASGLWAASTSFHAALTVRSTGLAKSEKV